MIAIAALGQKRRNMKPSFVMPNDLNNIKFFACIVEHGSLTAASESLGVAKSMLSQRLASLEKELGVQLIRRTSRRLQVTDIGKRYHAQCLVVLNEIARASRITDSIRTVPRGKLRIACPLNLAQSMLAPLLAAFLAKYPEVELALDITNRASALTQEGYDFAVHIGMVAKHSSLVTSSFSLDREVLVASPLLLARLGAPRRPADLKGLPSAAGQVPPDTGGRYVWHLSGPGNVRQVIQHFPRLLTEDLWGIRESVLAGCSIASLPRLMFRDAMDDGRFVQVLPEWTLREQKLLVTYPSRKGLTLAARTLIDFISGQLRTRLRSLQDGSVHLGVATYRRDNHLAT